MHAFGVALIVVASVCLLLYFVYALVMVETESEAEMKDWWAKKMKEWDDEDNPDRN